MGQHPDGEAGVTVMRKSSLHPHLFVFGGNADEELLLALAIALDRPTKDGLPKKMTASDLWELLEEPGEIHPSLSAEWTSGRKVGWPWGGCANAAS
jgi:hypothetical protein